MSQTQIKLLSTDFDGTLVNHSRKPPVTPALFEMLSGLRSRGVKWAVNTGRALEHIIEGLQEYRFPFLPDFVVTTERHVFRPSENGTGWDDYGDWNLRCEQAHQELFAAVRPLLNQIVSFIESETDAEMIYEDSLPAGLVASSDPEMDLIVEFIDRVRTIHPELHYQRNTIFLRFCHSDYSKGAALGELARLLKISSSEIFAIGDHYNDIAMLDGNYARWVACPGNSAEEVKSVVRKAGGYVAKAGCSEGVLEALVHFSAKFGSPSKSGTRRSG